MDLDLFNRRCQVKRTEVKSSQLVSVGYDAEKQIMEVEFKNAVYRYTDVPPETHAALMSAESLSVLVLGKYFAKEVRGKFKYEKLAQEVIK